MQLVPHPDFPPIAVTAIEADAWRDGERWYFRFLLDGTSALVLPEPNAPGRADDLWKTTCFEAFVGDSSYQEYNFSPSGQWAAYAFGSYRDARRNSPTDAEVWLDGGETWISLEATITANLAPGISLGLSAVIEEEGGVKSYWALAHPPGAPDFHHRSCFAATLPSIGAP